MDAAFDIQDKHFAVVTYPEEDNAYGVVPVKWMRNGKTCFFPNFVSEQKKNALVKAQAAPKQNWSIYNVTVLKYYSK